MTYEEFLFNVFKVSAAEFNDIVKYIDEPLPLNKASGLYNFHHPLRIYTLFFDKILNNIRLYYDIDGPNIKYSFLFFKIDDQFNSFPEEAKTKVVEQYYKLYNIYNKHHVDTVQVKSTPDCYYKEVLKIEPLFTKENVTKLLSEFDDSMFKITSYPWRFKNKHYAFIIFNLFYNYVLEYNSFEINCALYYLNDREYPKDLDLYLDSIFSDCKEMKEACASVLPNFKENVLKIYNKFIYWFELDRSFTI